MLSEQSVWRELTETWEHVAKHSSKVPKKESETKETHISFISDSLTFHKLFFHDNISGLVTFLNFFK